MRRIDSHTSVRGWFFPLLIAYMALASVAQAGQAGWKRQQVDWRISSGSRIRAINHPKDKIPPFLGENHRQARLIRKRVVTDKTSSRLTPSAQDSTSVIIASIIESPPVNGFIPWIVVSVTDARLGDLELDAIPYSYVVGDYLTDYPETDYIIGIFDTGATVHILGSMHAVRTGIDPDYLTSNELELIGVTGSAFAWVSKPVGIFTDGLSAIEPNGLLLDTSGMVGQSNVSILAHQDSGLLEKFTVIGSPLSVYFTTVIYNDRQVTVLYDEDAFTGPDIRIYEAYDPCIPNYTNYITLELRPADALAVQYFPDCEENFVPLIPSLITGTLPTQSLFFASSVDLSHGDKSAIDKDGFMVDTGAQVSVISEAIAARLGLNPDANDFSIEILDATGDVTIYPGFYIDSLDIIASPEWLSFTDVPVVMLDAPSPEGGTLDGIIGMNLFTEFNLVFRGGGLPNYGGHRLEFEPIPYRMIGDIAPEEGDDKVDVYDLYALAEAWLATPHSPNWYQRANMAPLSMPDGKVDFLDVSVLAEHWLEDTLP